MKYITMDVQKFNMVVDGVPYEIKATPFMFNTQQRFSVTYNGSEEYIFARDSEADQLIAIDSEAADIPDNLEEAISEKLISLNL